MLININCIIVITKTLVKFNQHALKKLTGRNVYEFVFT